MPISHPHADASYRVIAGDEGSFEVEVSIPDSHPTRVRPFAAAADAEKWIEEHRRRVQAQTETRRWQRRPAPASR
jgi:predicted metal-dependent hydrolase